MATIRLTVAQAVVRFLANQHSERDGVERRLIPGCFGIFGHGNVAGLGQALLQAQATGADDLPYYLARNEQAMVHAAVGYARTLNRLQTLACTASIGPGSSNMLTGAALATVNRIPVLLLPSDVFATRVAAPVLQELEQPYGYDVSVNDAFRPLSRFFDRVWRPEQLPAALMGAMRVLTDPADTGAVTIALPQDVQAEAWDWPTELFARRVWHVPRPVPEPAALDRAVAAIRAARRPLLVAGGGVVYAEASAALARFAEATGIPVADTQAGKGAIRWDHPQSVGGVGSTGSQAGNALAADADLVIGVGTRYSDFTTASHTAFRNPDVRFVNLNVAALRRRQAGRPHAGRRRARRPRCAHRRAGRPPVGRRLPRADRDARQETGTRSSTTPTISTTGRSPRRPPWSARSTRSWATATCSSRPPAASPATCRCCGGPPIPGSTTWSTATPAWATRSPAPSASRWPHRSGRCSRSSATAPT